MLPPNLESTTAVTKQWYWRLLPSMLNKRLFKENVTLSTISHIFIPFRSRLPYTPLWIGCYYRNNNTRVNGLISTYNLCRSWKYCQEINQCLLINWNWAFKFICSKITDFLFLRRSMIKLFVVVSRWMIDNSFVLFLPSMVWVCHPSP